MDERFSLGVAEFGLCLALELLLQVTLEDAALADQMFSILMGEDVEQRRSFIQRNAKDVRFLDI